MSNAYSDWVRDVDVTAHYGKGELEAYQGVEPWERTVWYDAQTFYTCAALFDEGGAKSGWEVYEIRIRKQKDNRYLLMVKAKKGKKYLVAFVSGDDFRDCFQLLQQNFRRGDLVWKEDRYGKF